jgi:hypothetical protein
MGVRFFNSGSGFHLELRGDNGELIFFERDAEAAGVLVRRVFGWKARMKWIVYTEIDSGCV